MKVSKLMAIIAFTFLFLITMSISAAQAATVINGGPATVFVKTNAPTGGVNSVNKLVADLSHPTRGEITSITLKGYVAYGASGGHTQDYASTVNIGYYRFNSNGSVDSITYQIPELDYIAYELIDITIIPMTDGVSSNPMSQAFLNVHAYGSDNYVYVSSFSSTNSTGDQFVVNYDPPLDYVNPDPPPDPDPDPDPDPTPDPTCSDTL